MTFWWILTALLTLFRSVHCARGCQDKGRRLPSGSGKAYDNPPIWERKWCPPCFLAGNSTIIWKVCGRISVLDDSTLLMFRYSMSGDHDFGYSMLHRAIEMAESIGIVNRPKLRLQMSQMSEDMVSSIKRTAWGLFQIDTYVLLLWRALSDWPCWLSVIIGWFTQTFSDQAMSMEWA